MDTKGLTCSLSFHTCNIRFKTIAWENRKPTAGNALPVQVEIYLSLLRMSKISLTLSVKKYKPQPPVGENRASSSTNTTNKETHDGKKMSVSISSSPETFGFKSSEAGPQHRGVAKGGPQVPRLENVGLCGKKRTLTFGTSKYMSSIMDLDVDSVIEILSHLPVKSVFRSKCVCKSWCKIIGSSAFRKSHFVNQSKNKDDDEDDTLYLQFRQSEWTLSPLLFPHNWKSYDEFPADIQNLFFNGTRSFSISNLIIDGPINGLMLMHSNRPHKYDFAVFNPCLREFKILPPSPMCSSYCGFSDTRGIGFGFDNLTKEYKVVQLITSFKSGRVYVEVYSGRTNTWRQLVTDFLDDFYMIYDYHKFKVIKSRGTIVYWQPISDQKPNLSSQDVILSFDMHNESFETIKLPEFDVWEEYEVLAKDDSLVVFLCNFGSSLWKVWELDKERGWTRVKNVNVGISAAWPIALWKDGLVLKQYDRYRVKSWILSGWRRGRTKKFVELPKCEIFDQILEYKCTLYSVSGDMPLI